MNSGKIPKRFRPKQPKIEDRWALCQRGAKQAPELGKSIRAYKRAMDVVEKLAYRLQSATPHAEKLSWIIKRTARVRELLNQAEVETYALEVEQGFQQCWEQLEEVPNV